MKKENRRHSRYRLFAMSIIETGLDRSGIKVAAHIENLSESGMGVFVSSEIRKDTPVSIEIIFTDVLKNEMREKIRGTVVHASKQNDLYYLGISFSEPLSPEKHPYLYDYFCKENL